MSGTAKENKRSGSVSPGAEGTFVLRLYVTGGAPRSSWAVRNVSKLCEEHLHGRYDLEVIDLYQQPWLARDAQLVAAPTLVKERPLPERRFIGAMSDGPRLLAGLGIEPPAQAQGAPPVLPPEGETPT